MTYTDMLFKTIKSSVLKENNKLKAYQNIIDYIYFLK